ncbi:site-specific integrase [Agromyces larvae]|uniref:Site-specific integrase n=1 Tax=Agromyces larvae TaxID=2929802 RepID=A0ABY4C1B4_9MICO|nr:site-specific integrase [Agromyces larvae]UOE45278.1 site-specific integrase [Agromyces larvae]
MARTKAPARRTPGPLGTVREERSGRFRASYRLAERIAGDDGIERSVTRTFRAPRTFATRAEALGWLAKERADRHEGTWHDPRLGAGTLADYAATWLADRPELAAGTRALYRHSLDRWVLPRVPTATGDGTELGRLPLKQITPAMVRTWHAEVMQAAREAVRAQKARSLTRRPSGHPARRWGPLNGFPAGTQGPMSRTLLEAWERAGCPDPALAEPAPRIEVPVEAGRTATAQAYRVLHAMLATAHRDGLIPSNPCHIRGASSSFHPERPIASPAEVEALAAAFPEHLNAAVLLAAWSGLRYGELFGLARRHVDLEAGTLRVERALVFRKGAGASFGPTKTPRSRRVVHLPGFVVERLRGHLERFVGPFPESLLFTSQRTGSPIPNSRISEYMKPAREAIGRPELTWHTLRHTGATLAYQAGASVREVQNRLGHTTQAAAAIYQHAADGSDRLLADRLDELHRNGRVTPIRAS